MNEQFSILKKQPFLAHAMQRVLQADKLAHAYLLEGAKEAGQEEMALFLAAGVFCMSEQRPCGECPICQRILQRDYGDLEWMTSEESTIRIDQIRDLKRDLSLTGMEGNQRVFVIEQAEKMTVQAANSLLKFLEEPHASVYIFLLTCQREAILPTIQSRCQILHFVPLPLEKQVQVLMEEGIGQERALILSHMSHDVEKAKALNEDEIFNKSLQLLQTWLPLILRKDPRAFIMVTTDWMKLTKKREEISQLLQLMGLFLRDMLLVAAQGEDAQAHLIQTNHYDNYLQTIQRYREENILQIIQLLPKAQRMLKSHVSPQAVLENLVLKAFAIKN